MLFAAGHVKNDLPWEINSFWPPSIRASRVDSAATWRSMPKLLEAARDRIEAAERAAVPMWRGPTRC